MQDLRQAILSPEPLIADGSITTALYEKGFYINRSFEELSLTNSEAVKLVHQEFMQAGSQILHTNTFGASLPRLSEYGLQDSFEEILKTSTELALEVAQDSAWVVGSIGPQGLVLEPLGPASYAEVQELFRKNIKILDSAGVHGFSLRSFHNLKELELAICAVRQESNKPILAHIAIQENQKTSFGVTLKEFVTLSTKLNVDVMGITGQVGPSALFEAFEQIKKLTRKPVSLLPTAGLPRFVNNEYFYLTNPDYMAKYAKRMVQAGVKIVGGSSGVHAKHIKAISNSVRMLHPQIVEQGVIEIVESDVLAKEPLAREKRSLLGKKLANKETIFSVELTPLKGVDYEKFFDRCRDLQAGGVEFVNIPDGARAMARMSSLQLAVFVKNNFNLEPIPHFTCRDRNLLGLQADLMGVHVNGVRNLLLVTGDPPKLGNCPDATAVYDVDSIGLTTMVSQMNRGLDLGGSDFGKPTDFLVGVALNPTSHNLELEAQRFSFKMEAGADFVMTQPIYDIEAFSHFFDKHVNSPVPVIMGVWPLVSLRNAEFLKNEVPGVSIPDWIITEMEKAGDNSEEAMKRGIEIAVRTIEKAKGLVAGFQVNAPFNRARLAVEVIKNVRGS